MNRKKMVKISAILCVFVVAVAGFVGFFALSKGERAEGVSVPAEPVPLVYKKGDEMKIKLKNRESKVVTKLDNDFRYYGNVRIPKNNSGIFYKGLVGDVGELGTLWYSPLPIEEEVQLTKTDKWVGHARVKSDGSLALNVGTDLCIFNLKENICIDTGIEAFKVTPDEKKIIYYKNDGKVYTADFSIDAKPELLFDTGEEIGDMARYFWCKPDLSEVLFSDGNGCLFHYKNGRCKKIARGLYGGYAVPVKNAVYYKKEDKDGLYCCIGGIESCVDKDDGNIFIDYKYDEDKCFRDIKVIRYIVSSKNKMIFFTGGRNGTVVENISDPRFGSNYSRLFAIENGVRDLVCYDVTTRGLENKRKVLSGVKNVYSASEDIVAAECNDGTYVLIGDECKKISDERLQGRCEACGETLCYLSDEGVLYTGLNGSSLKEIGKNVEYYYLREDESIAWITNKGELYVKYKNSPPELADTEVEEIYDINK